MIDSAAVEHAFRHLQNQLTGAFAALDGSSFRCESWKRDAGGGGESRVLENGPVIEKGGVNFSDVQGERLPPSASASRPELADRAFRAMGVSVVVHPRNPYAPTSHMNVRFFQATREGEEPVWWFGGGFDLTPYYGFEEDARYWHECARAACLPAGDDVYPNYKACCDRYFYLKHRDEARGIGGIFFDDLNELGFEDSFAMARRTGEQYLAGLLPILERRKKTPFGERERAWQLYRRGRYVEFNLVYDRGTLFGLQSGGRTESILMSLPPLVTWKYHHQPEPGSEEERLVKEFLPARDWIA